MKINIKLKYKSIYDNINNKDGDWVIAKMQTYSELEPKIIYEDKNDKKKTKTLFYSKDTMKIESILYEYDEEPHREDGPARIEFDENNGDINYEQYYKDGAPFRKDGPAIIKYHSNGNVAHEVYCTIPVPKDDPWKEGIIHREDGPADILYYEDGSVMQASWYIDGILVKSTEYKHDKTIHYKSNGETEIEYK